MDPMEQRTVTVVERMYAHLLAIKIRKGTTYYVDCFKHGFDMPYSKKYVHLITKRKGVVNNIPYILGAFGRTCNELRMPPLCCLVVKADTGHCGVGVITSQVEPAGGDVEFAERVDRPNVYNYANYPQPGTQEARAFLNRVIERLREQGLVRE
jgi:hypothetical protein